MEGCWSTRQKKKTTRQNCFYQLAKLFWSSRQIALVKSPNSIGQLAKNIQIINHRNSFNVLIDKCFILLQIGLGALIW